VHIILIPGLWLNGDSWRQVARALERAGHRSQPLTLPGMESLEADRSGITLRHHVDAVVAAIDAASPDDGKVVLVGHSAGCAIAYASVDARPDRVAHAVYVGGFPVAGGLTVADEFPVEGSDVPLPDWSQFEPADLAGMDEAALAAFRARAIPSPAQVTLDRQQLSDERRYGVPVTAVCPEYTADMLRSWIEKGMGPVSELAKIAQVTYVDLPTGHWPQLTRPDDLARIIISSSSRQAGWVPVVIDEHGRIEPPDAGDETGTLLAFLDYQRATLEWKCTGVNAAGMRATVAASSMTLGGLLKHMTIVEDIWFSERFAGIERRPPWSAIDWAADPDWEWRSAAEDDPDDLIALWCGAVERARERVHEALARGGLDQLATGLPGDARRVPSLRWIVVHMIEEYARHNGHADLIREAVDGVTGE